jgi:hypothetical protein
MKILKVENERIVNVRKEDGVSPYNIAYIYIDITYEQMGLFFLKSIIKTETIFKEIPSFSIVSWHAWRFLNNGKDVFDVFNGEVVDDIDRRYNALKVKNLLNTKIEPPRKKYYY